MGAAEHSAQDTVDRLRRAAALALAPAVAGIDQVVLLHFPNHGNVGDSAIWLGTREWLRARRIRVSHASDFRRYDPRLIRRRLTETSALLVHGGGNFGDLYPQIQQRRLGVWRDFPDVRIVQLPQTTHFFPDGLLRETVAAAKRHPDLWLFGRDRQSGDQLSEMSEHVAVAPDMAHFLRPRQTTPSEPIVILGRTDKEAAEDRDPRLPGADWPRSTEGLLGLVDRTSRRLMARRLTGPANVVAAPIWDRLARQRVERGLAILSPGRTIVTDRLHGMILGLGLQRRVVAADDAHGKVARYYDTWLSGSGLVTRTSRLTDVLQPGLREFVHDS